MASFQLLLHLRGATGLPTADYYVTFALVPPNAHLSQAERWEQVLPRPAASTASLPAPVLPPLSLPQARTGLVHSHVERNTRQPEWDEVSRRPHD